MAVVEKKLSLAKRTVVVLEFTVLAQGLPWPENLGTALEMEAVIRGSLGAVPATIAVLDGVPRIGLRRGRSSSGSAQSALKVPVAGRRNEMNWGDVSAREPFPLSPRQTAGTCRPCLARGDSAATTVSATLWLAERRRLAAPPVCWPPGDSEECIGVR